MTKVTYTDKKGRQYVKSHSGNDNKITDVRGNAVRTGWMGYYSPQDIKSFRASFAIRGGNLEEFVENFIKLTPQLGNASYGFLIFSNREKRHGYGIREIVSVKTEEE